MPQVTGATCTVLAETLSTNTELQLLVLQDNPLGAAGARVLLRALHAGAGKGADRGPTQGQPAVQTAPPPPSGMCAF